MHPSSQSQRGQRREKMQSLVAWDPVKKISPHFHTLYSYYEQFTPQSGEKNGQYIQNSGNIGKQNLNKNNNKA